MSPAPSQDPAADTRPLPSRSQVPPPPPEGQSPETPANPSLSADTNRPYPRTKRTPFGGLPGEPEVIKEMVRLRRAGLGHHSIARDLNQREVPTRYGGIWHPLTVWRILRREDPDLCPPQETTPPVPQRLAGQRYRDLDRQRKHRAAARSEVAA